ncbi:MAG: sensor histidine kinase [Burkholderiaceae bacterium]
MPLAASSYVFGGRAFLQGARGREMKTTSVISDTDWRFGSHWLASLDAAGRTALMAEVISRFNHDLRTPLNTILGWTHLLQQGGLDAARAKHVADVIARNSRDQTQLLEDFVDDGRAVLGALELQRVALNMDGLLADASTRLSPLLTLHGVSLDEDFDTTGVSVSGDLRRLTRLAYRLLTIVTRRAREATKIEIETDVDRSQYVMALSGTAYEPEWSDAAVLDLRISTLVAALHEGDLQVGADATRPCIMLRLPCS